MNRHSWRWTQWVVLVICVVLAPVAAQAQFFGQVSTARPLDRGNMDVGAFLGVFEHATVLFGQYRYGLFSRGDGGIQFGVVDPEGGGDMGMGVSGDLKFPLMSAGQSNPFDLSVAPRLGFFDYSGVTILEVGGAVIISRDYALEHGFLSPYAAVNMRMESVEDADNEFDIGALAGLKWDMSDLLDSFGEVILDDEIGVIVGLNFKL